MAAGIRVTVAFSNLTDCPIGELSARTGAVINDVSTSVASSTDADCTSEFLVDADAVPADYEHDPVFTYADRHCYRVPHEGDCPCSCLGEFETPIDRYFADGNTLRLVFHARDFDRLQTVVGEIRDRYPGVDIQRLVRAPTEGAARDTVFVDRGQLTDRQLEVLRTAYEKGYFEQPREANATEVADELGITQSTFSEHLLSVQSKLFGDVLEEGS